MGIRFEPLVSEQDHDATTSGHRLDRSPILPL
jgi:hypothetical protein